MGVQAPGRRFARGTRYPRFADTSHSHSHSRPARECLIRFIGILAPRLAFLKREPGIPRTPTPGIFTTLALGGCSSPCSAFRRQKPGIPHTNTQTLLTHKYSCPAHVYLLCLIGVPAPAWRFAGETPVSHAPFTHTLAPRELTPRILVTSHSLRKENQRC